MGTTKRGRHRLICFRDLTDAGVHFVLFIVGWLVPLRAIWIAVKPLAVAHSYLGHLSLPDPNRLREAIARTSYDGSTRSFDIRRLQFTYHDTALRLRLLRPGAGLSIELIGRENIDRALAKGHGVILLVANVTYGDYVAKAAMSSAGVPISHLSIPGHGSSGTRFGRRVITGIRIAVENRYIHERIIRAPGNRLRPLKTLEQRLRDNCVVSITAVSGTSSIPIRCLDGTTALGRAAPALSRKTGAAVLPVFALPSTTGNFTVHVGEALNAEGTGAVFEAALGREFGRQLEDFVRRYPTNWPGWANWDYSAPTSASEVPGQ